MVLWTRETLYLLLLILSPMLAVHKNALKVALGFKDTLLVSPTGLR